MKVQRRVCGNIVAMFKKRGKNEKPESHKLVPEEQMFNEKKPDQKMGIKKPAMSDKTGEMVLPSTNQRSFLKRRSAKHRRKHERELIREDISDLESTDQSGRQ